MASGGGGGGAGAGAAAAVGGAGAGAAPVAAAAGAIALVAAVPQVRAPPISYYIGTYLSMASERIKQYFARKGEIKLSDIYRFINTDDIKYIPPAWLIYLNTNGYIIDKRNYDSVILAGKREMAAGLALLRMTQTYDQAYPEGSNSRASPHAPLYNMAQHTLLKHTLLYLVYEFYKFELQAPLLQFYINLNTAGSAALVRTKSTWVAPTGEIIPHVRYIPDLADKLNSIIMGDADLARLYLLEPGGGARESARFPKLIGVSTDVSLLTKEQILTEMEPAIRKAEEFLDELEGERKSTVTLDIFEARNDIRQALGRMANPGPGVAITIISSIADGILSLIGSLVGAGEVAAGAMNRGEHYEELVSAGAAIDSARASVKYTRMGEAIAAAAGADDVEQALAAPAASGASAGAAAGGGVNSAAAAPASGAASGGGGGGFVAAAAPSSGVAFVGAGSGGKKTPPTAKPPTRITSFASKMTPGALSRNLGVGRKLVTGKTSGEGSNSEDELNWQKKARELLAQSTGSSVVIGSGAGSSSGGQGGGARRTRRRRHHKTRSHAHKNRKAKTHHRSRARKTRSQH